MLELGDNLFVLDIALGIGDSTVILALNLEITYQNVMEGSLYCIPYTSLSNRPWFQKCFT